jgi:hypothetical protein
MTCAGPLKEQERPYREYRWKAEFDPYPSSGVDSVVMHKHSFQFSDVLS